MTIAIPDDLEAILADILRRLGRAAQDRKAAMHAPVVGTIAADGSPALRVMVLRAFDPAAARLRFHSDARAAKVAQIGDAAPISVLCYDPGAKLQFRLTGTARIEYDSPVADQAWQNATLFARRCYLADPAPGSLSDAPVSGLTADIAGRVPDDEDEVAPGRVNFALLLADINRIEWLFLAHTGHRRALFERYADGRWYGQWMVP
ncbi:pyridoxamine 5'-phosphate oxidase family protein [Blastomonas sp.]|uniref:pyridoxamine 5'-phosphate oxidase family protein n=1 Tax=Blastomonas sp. TaxID=1909299 RepID=UPI003593EEF7